MYHYVEHVTYPDGSSGTGCIGYLEGKRMFSPDDNKVELMQYTGLRDKNGREIYEGDIVRIPGNYISYGTHNAAIEWSEQALGWTASGLRLEHRFDTPDTPTELEIIGNIYEHHDLLPQDSDN